MFAPLATARRPPARPAPPLQIFQNGVLLEKVLQGLDAAFQASAVLSVKELRLMAQVVREVAREQPETHTAGQTHRYVDKRGTRVRDPKATRPVTPTAMPRNVVPHSSSSSA